MTTRTARLWEMIGGSATLLLFVCLVAVTAVMSMVADGFASIATMQSIMWASSWLGLLAIGTTLALSAGAIDFSVMAVAALSGIVAAWLGANVSVFAVLPGAIACGVVVGLANASIVVRVGANAFLATLVVGGVVRGVDFSLGQGQRGVPVEDWLLGVFARSTVGPFPVTFVAVIVLAAVGVWVVSSTQFGRALIAAGGNRDAARIIGLRPNRIQTLAYLISGCVAAVAGLMLASRVGAGIPAAGLGQELSLFAAVLIAGTSLFGGRSNIVGSLLAVVLLQTLFNGLVLLGLPDRFQQVIAGCLLIISVSLTSGSLARWRAERARQRLVPARVNVL